MIRNRKIISIAVRKASVTLMAFVMPERMNSGIR